jgi:predicted N-acetyltransferase YhbS
MIYQLYDYEQNDAMLKLFNDTFTESEGAQEGKLISDLVYNFIHKTPKEYLRIFVAKDDNKLVAAIIFSKLNFKVSNIKAYLMAPVAVYTPYQGQGVGQELINYGHDCLRKENIDICLTYGDINFYSKTGYSIISEKQITPPVELSYPQGWLGLSLKNLHFPVIEEKPNCVEVIRHPKYW